MPSLKIKRGTRAQITSAAAASGLRVGELYHVTDEGRVELGTAVGASVALANKSELDAKQNALPSGSAVGNVLSWDGTSWVATGELPVGSAAIYTFLMDVDVTPTTLETYVGTTDGYLEFVALMDHATRWPDVLITPTAIAAVAGSGTAINALLLNSSALSLVMASAPVMQTIAASNTAMTIVVASNVAMTVIATNIAAMIAVASSSTAMDALNANQTYRTIFTTSTALTAVINPIMTGSASPSGSVVASSTYSIFYAWKSLDNDPSPNSYWLSGTGQVTSQWIRYYFTSPVFIHTFKLISRTGSGIKDFRLEYSDDDANWTSCVTATHPEGGTLITYPVNGIGKHLYWRIFCVNSWVTTNIAICDFRLEGFIW